MFLNRIPLKRLVLLVEGLRLGSEVAKELTEAGLCDIIQTSIRRLAAVYYLAGTKRIRIFDMI